MKDWLKRKLISTFVCQRRGGYPIQFLEGTVILASCVTVLVFLVQRLSVGAQDTGGPPRGFIRTLGRGVYSVKTITPFVFAINTVECKRWSRICSQWGFLEWESIAGTWRKNHSCDRSQALSGQRLFPPLLVLSHGLWCRWLRDLNSGAVD